MCVSKNNSSNFHLNLYFIKPLSPAPTNPRPAKQPVTSYAAAAFRRSSGSEQQQAAAATSAKRSSISSVPVTSVVKQQIAGKQS